MSLSSCAFWEFLFVFDFQLFDFNVSQCGPLWVYTAWNFLTFFVFYIHVFSQVWEDLAIISSDKLSAPFSLFPLWDSHFYM